MNTNDLSQFSDAALREAGQLLIAYANNNHDNFYEGGVKLEYNPTSQKVFITNDDCQVLMADGEDLREWYWLSYAGEEGFALDLYGDFRNGNIDENDYEQLADILESEGLDAEAADVRAKMEGEDEQD